MFFLLLFWLLHSEVWYSNIFQPSTECEPCVEVVYMWYMFIVVWKYLSHKTACSLWGPDIEFLQNSWFIPVHFEWTEETVKPPSLSWVYFTFMTVVCVISLPKTDFYFLNEEKMSGGCKFFFMTVCSKETDKHNFVYVPLFKHQEAAARTSFMRGQDFCPSHTPLSLCVHLCSFNLPPLKMWLWTCSHGGS